MSDDDDDDDEPYGDPAARPGPWSKNGPSPNPGGRPKSSLRERAKAALEKVLSEFITFIDTAGNKRRIPAGEALMRKLVERSTKSARAARLYRMQQKQTGVLAADPPPGPRVGVLAVSRYMTEEECDAKYGGVRMSTNPLDGLPGIDAEALERAIAEKRRMQQEGYDAPQEEDEPAQTPLIKPAPRRGRTANDR